MMKNKRVQKQIFMMLAGLAFIVAGQTVEARMVSDIYPLLSNQFLKYAELVETPEDVVLKTDTGIIITGQDLEKAIANYNPKLKDQLKENFIFLLEQETITGILKYEIKKNGTSNEKGELNDQISAYLSEIAKETTVSDVQVKNFYDENKEMVGGVPFEQVRETIREFLIESGKQDAIRSHMDDLGRRHRIQINRQWMDNQYAIMKNNPVDRARASGKPTMIEFGATGCIPCDMMQPILENLRKKFPDSLNVEFVHVNESQILAGRFGIQSIPVQVFFDNTGNEVFRHTGFFAEKEVLEQLEKMGVTQ